ncbi:hypothetical protein JCM11491_006455 [Sporobolomyces phaffii]
MRLVRAYYCLLLCGTAAVASSSPDASPSSTAASTTIDDAPSTVTSTAEAPQEPTIRAATTFTSSSISADPAREEDAPTEGISSILATPTSTSLTLEGTTSTQADSTTSATPSEPPPPPSTSVSHTTSSPPPSETPSLSIPPVPSISIVADVPLQPIPPVPEFLSFNEWKEKYVVVPDPSVALAKRAKKAAQRQRQDAAGAGATGDRGATYDGDGADLGSLFTAGDDAGDLAAGGSGSGTNPAEVARRDETRSKAPRRDDAADRTRADEPADAVATPIQPLANVGTCDDADPLVALRDRSNYAAFECAAMVHRSSRKTKGASAILVEKKDRYMLTPCAAEPKFVEVELCDEIQIDTIVLANFEFFSSMFKHFKASCSVNYPGTPEDWHDLGTFRARNMRGVQVFRPNLIRNFCRYIRINFLSHFGSEYYCPVSLLRVYGYTQLDAYRESERKARQLEAALAAAEEYVEEDDAEDVEDVENEAVTATESAGPTAPPTEDRAETGDTVQRTVVPMEEEESKAQDSKRSNATESDPNDGDLAQNRSSRAHPDSTRSNDSMLPLETSIELSSPAHTSLSPAPTPAPTATETRGTNSSGASQPREVPSSPVESTTSIDSHVPPSSETDSLASTPSTSHPSVATSVAPAPPSNTSATQPISSSIAPLSSASSRPATPSDLPIINPRPLATRNDTPPHVQPHRPPVISPPIQQPQPGESIYATIMKRLTSLEHNQTLSMHFIEAQSSMLREAFTRIERRLGEVETTRSRQEQGIRQALVDLEKERNELQREKLGLSTQVGMLAHEIRLEKRLSAIQLVGTLLVLVFVGFTRSIPTSPFLHLASSAQTKDRDPAKRATDEIDDQQLSADERSSPDLARRSLARRSSGNGGAKHSSGHSKRFPSMSKPGPRRHYGTGTSSSSRTPAFAKSPRAWTPPVRHSSAPPEEPPSTSISTALEGKEPRRRHGSTRRPGSPFEFPRRSKLDTQLGLAIEPILADESTSSSPASFSNPLPPYLNAASHQHYPSAVLRPSTADEADTERARLGDPLDPVANGDYDHYTTTDDEDEPPSVPARERILPVTAQSGSPPPSTSGPRPPKPTLPSRPSTSMGIPFPSPGLSSRSDSDFRRTPHHHHHHRPVARPPTPPSTLPTPPPEPALAFDPAKPTTTTTTTTMTTTTVEQSPSPAPSSH